MNRSYRSWAIALASSAVFVSSLASCKKAPQSEFKGVNVAPSPQAQEPITAPPVQPAPSPDGSTNYAPLPSAQSVEFKGPMNAPALPVITGKGPKASIPKGSFSGEGRK